MSSKHEFAVYVANLSFFRVPKTESILLQDAESVHRIRSVLRLTLGKELTLFDGSQQVRCRIEQIDKKNISLHILSTERIAQLSPSITVLLPLLKREALEHMLYACVELGANAIQLIMTEKSQHAWRSEHDLKRAQAIMIAAAEQSKQFSIPTIHAPCSLQQAVQQHIGALHIVADPAGTPLYEIMMQVRQNIPMQERGIVITMGPEGDFTDAEKELLRVASYQSVHLTPTVLRSQQAGALLLGIIRSIISE